MISPPPPSTLFPYTTLFRSSPTTGACGGHARREGSGSVDVLDRGPLGSTAVTEVPVVGDAIAGRGEDDAQRRWAGRCRRRDTNRGRRGRCGRRAERED